MGRRRQGLPSAWFKLAQKLRQFCAAGEKELTAKLRNFKKVRALVTPSLGALFPAPPLS